MAKFNPKTFMKTSNIQDEYWQKSLHIYDSFIKALEEGREEDLIVILQNPYFHTGEA